MSREQTDYAKNRPRRELPGPRNTLGVTTESLELCRLHEFVGAPGSGAPLAQPFSVFVAAEVRALHQTHTHTPSACSKINKNSDMSLLEPVSITENVVEESRIGKHHC